MHWLPRVSVARSWHRCDKATTCNVDDVDAMCSAMHAIALDYPVHKAVALPATYDVIAI